MPYDGHGNWIDEEGTWGREDIAPPNNPTVPGMRGTLTGNNTIRRPQTWATDYDVWGEGITEATLNPQIPQPLPPLEAARVTQAQYNNYLERGVMPAPRAINEATFGATSKKKKTELQKITIDKETFSALESITNEIIQQHLDTLKKIYKKRLDFIENKEYDELITTVRHRNRDYDDEVSDETYAVDCLNTTKHFWKTLTSGLYMSNCSYLKDVEKKANERYNIEYSKYKYYPRLKKTVKYGNAELLAKILTVTQINKGKIICPSL